MKEIKFLTYRLQGELSTRMSEKDVLEVLEVLRLTEEYIEELKTENQWLYGKLNTISAIVEESRNATPMRGI